MPRLRLAVILAALAAPGWAQSSPPLGAAPDTLAVRAIAAEPAVQPLPAPRAYAGAAVIGERVYLFGGWSSATPSIRDTLSLDPATGRWTHHQPIPDALMESVSIGGSSVELGGKILLGSASGATRRTLIYDPSADSWTAGPLFVHPRAGMGLFSAAGRVFALAGVDGESDSVPEIERLAGGRWVDEGLIPNPPAYPATASVGRKAYLIGGADPHPGLDPRIGDLKEFDLVTGKWRTLASMPTPRRGAAVAVLGGRIYVAGGDAAINGPALGVLEVYDPAAGTWSSAPPPPRPRVFSAAAALKGKLYLFGGLTPDLRGSVTVQVYDPVSRLWSVSDDPSARPTWGPAPAPNPDVVRRRPLPSAPRFERKAAERPQDYALVIGVGSYKRLPPAQFADGDAREMAAALAALGVPEENIVQLTGPKATMSEVSKYVEEWLPRRVSKDSRVYFYFSGHGAPDVKDGSAYLMPWDADAAFVKSTGFPLSRLYASLGGLPASHVVAMIDACFSGAGGRSVIEAGIRPLVSVRLPKKLPPRITVLAAAESEEIAGILPERGHGLFSYYALQGLSGAADVEGTGHVTVSDLYSYVRKHVILDARRQNREQTPTLTTPTPKLKLY